MPLFSFELDTLQITDTRSAHKDSDYVSFTLKIGGAAPQNVAKSLGDLNNGTFNIGLSYGDQNIPPDTTVVLNYLIINSGGGPGITASGIESGLTTLGTRLADVPSFNLPPHTSSLQLVASTFHDELSSIINPNSCDGLVAAEQNTFTYDQLLSNTSQYPFFTETTSHIGAKAPNNCNSRPSAYVVRWSMKQLVVVPQIDRMLLGDAKQTLSRVPLGAMVKPGDPTSNNSEVTGANPVVGSLAPINSIVTLATMIAP
jgi:hypothetical protein